jgi:hypothetical protein
MSVNNTPRVITEDSRVTLKILASLTDDSRGVNYDCNMFIDHATGSIAGFANIKPG